jgi:tripartite-type tricarboxylate transporter receptor subunit TctC
MVTLPRRAFLHLVAGAAALPAAARIARAETYPSRPVRLVVGFAPGGGNDIVARIMGQWLSQRTGQQFFIENRPGAGTNIATEVVVNASPDGYTLLLAGLPNAYNAALYDKLKFNFIRDVVPVAGVARGPLVMVLHPSVPAKTVPAFIAYAKANPGKVNMASSGTGGGGHLAGELFKMMAGVDLVHVPYRGNGPALAALLGGQVEVLFPTLASSIAYIRAGTLRGLAVTGAMRSDALPDLPTVGEFVPGYEVTAWYGVGAPKGTPAGVIDKLNKEIDAGLADPEMMARFVDLGDVPMSMSPAAFAKLIADETEKWGKVVKFAGIKPE